MIINVYMEDGTVWIDPSADRIADVEGDIQSPHRTPPNRIGEETAKQIPLTPWAARCGFLKAGTEGGNRKLNLRPGRTGSVVKGGSNTTGGWRIGSRTRRAVHSRAGGKAGDIDTSENTGLRQSTKTTSVHQSWGGRIYPFAREQGKDLDTTALEKE